MAAPALPWCVVSIISVSKNPKLCFDSATANCTMNLHERCLAEKFENCRQFCDFGGQTFENVTFVHLQHIHSCDIYYVLILHEILFPKRQNLKGDMFDLLFLLI